MANGKDIAWTPILLCTGIGLAALAAGAFLVGPAIQKAKAKKLEAKKKKAGEKEENLKKAA